MAKNNPSIYGPLTNVFRHMVRLHLEKQISYLVYPLHFQVSLFQQPNLFLTCFSKTPCFVR